MTVGVSLLSKDLSTHIYKDAVTGVDASNITNETKVLKVKSGVLAALDHSTDRDPNALATDWDLRVWNYGEDMAAPQQYLLDTNALILRYAMTYDCNLFDVNGFCISGSLRYTDVQGAYGASGSASEFAGVLTGAVRIASKVRIGGFLDWGTNPDNVDGVKYTSNIPTVGAFIGYSDAPDDTGIQARLAAAYNHENADFTRANLLGTSAKAKGNSSFNTYGFLAELGYGFDVGNTMVVTPFLGLAGTKSTRDGYNESGDNGGVFDPLNYDSYTATEVTGIAGVRLKGSISDQLSYRLSLGVEHDFSYNVDAFKLSGNFGSSSYKTNEAPADWRLAGSAGLSYLFAPDKEFNLDGYVSQFDKNAPAYTVMVGFKMGY